MTSSSQDAGSVASGIVRPTEPGPEIRCLDVLIGRWITEGHLVDEAGAPSGAIVASDVYEWAPGGFFVIHPAYGRIAGVDVGGVEVIGYDPTTQRYWSQFFDSQGNASTSELILENEHWIWRVKTPVARRNSARTQGRRLPTTSAATRTGIGCHRWKWCSQRSRR